ncbi:ubiquitin fusion degradation protein 1 (UFD1) [Babesia microti strain RI]|uniref:Ubiquitin fusion degradation protein 1 (UFD1) n=1 Tax=Babesia microti (strain RI) TaxID=1133968 RepID=A0A1R4ABJ5_BABMR|nr:ubiquitin fusion degradation protein 1 (UFD1) [Babesia microti strain RI]SJK86368.1 ubiquitin fusion degradation protein 1 (UFD1) [Babesia microti strain RI]|eukprot:XP_021338531.1 ubiquitin fusion degradation protein 1 (UFD1) [Babesia microti strain RI]
MNYSLLLLSIILVCVARTNRFEHKIFCSNGNLFKRSHRFGFLPTASIIRHFLNAIYDANVEQYIKDLNILLESRKEGIRFLMAMKLDETFSKPSSVDGDFTPLHSNKACLPECFSPDPNESELLIHLLVERVHYRDYQGKGEGLERVTIGVLDFRAPDGFIFLPPWMFSSLNIKERDIVRVHKTRLSDAISVRLRPTSGSIFSVEDQKSFLEKRLKYYSNLTKNTTISILDQNSNNVFNFKVVNIATENKENVEAASIQDVDVAVDLLPVQFNSV